MQQRIKVINLGGVNCYLIEVEDDFILIDTGMASNRTTLERELENAGCKPGKLKLILLTHGDMDHAENCAYLRDKYGAKVSMHSDDSGMVEHGDMGWNRKAKPDKISGMGRIIMSLSRILLFFSKSEKFEIFKPDFFVIDGQDLSEHGFDARVLSLPGHSKGSIGILTADGDLFCGDLLMNFTKPSVHFMIDDDAAMNSSLEKLRRLVIHTIYPGHGKQFTMETFNLILHKDYLPERE